MRFKSPLLHREIFVYVYIFIYICIYFLMCRKQQTMTMGEHHIRLGETMMILMNIFGKLERYTSEISSDFSLYSFSFFFFSYQKNNLESTFSLLYFCFYLTRKVHVSGHFIALNLAGHGVRILHFS